MDTTYSVHVLTPVLFTRDTTSINYNRPSSELRAWNTSPEFFQYGKVSFQSSQHLEGGGERASKAEKQ